MFAYKLIAGQMGLVDDRAKYARYFIGWRDAVLSVLIGLLAKKANSHKLANKILINIMFGVQT